MGVLDDKTKLQIKAELENITNIVTIHLFTQELECQFCRENRMIAEELSAIIPEKVKLEIHNFVTDKEAVAKYKIDKIPAMAIVGEHDYGIRFYGVPGGYEFTSLFTAIQMVGSGKSGLSPATIAKCVTLDKPVHLKVYVTLTCPYCPQTVHLADQLAMVTPMITAEMIEAAEFPHLATKEQIMGVPKTVVEGYGSFEGALPEEKFVDKVLSLVSGASK